MIHTTREAWLTGGITLLRPHFKDAGGDKPGRRGEHGYTVPDNVRVTCGWPSKGALARKNQRIGECWSDRASKGKLFEMFISPSLAEPVEVLGVLTHELVHATVGLEAKHGKLFKRCALAVGLAGKMRATTTGPELAKVLDKIAAKLGPYPHHELTSMTTGERKQGTRLVKAECAVCGYTVRVTRKWLDAAGAPLCPTANCDEHGQALSVEGEGEEA
jgi:hypothetical protein